MDNLFEIFGIRTERVRKAIWAIINNQVPFLKEVICGVRIEQLNFGKNFDERTVEVLEESIGS